LPSVFLSNHRAPFRAASVEIIGGGGASYPVASARTHKIAVKCKTMSALGQKQMCVAKRHVRFAPESGIRQPVMSALSPKAHMCSARGNLRYGPIADIHSSAPTKRKTPGNCPGFCLH